MAQATADSAPAVPAAEAAPPRVVSLDASGESRSSTSTRTAQQPSPRTPAPLARANTQTTMRRLALHRHLTSRVRLLMPLKGREPQHHAEQQRSGLSPMRRLLFLFLNLLIIWGILVAASGVRAEYIGALKMSSSRYYDPSRGLTLHTRGCDVYLEHGERPVVEYSSFASAWGITWQYDHGVEGYAFFDATFGTSPARAVRANNDWDSCRGAPLFNCSEICTVRVSVPHNTSTVAPTMAVIVQQAEDDHSGPRLFVSGVGLKSLDVGPASSLSVDLVETLVAGPLKVDLGVGSARIVGGRFDGPFAVTTAGSGSVFRQIDVGAPLNLGGRSPDVAYLQPRNRLCVLGAASLPTDSSVVGGGVVALGGGSIGGEWSSGSSPEDHSTSLGLLGSAKGEVRVEVRPAATAGGGEYGWQPNATNIGKPLEKLGVQFERLAEARDRIADPTNDAFVVLDVSLTGSPLPTTRWLYTEQTVWTAVSPAVFGFLTFSMLSPLVVREHITLLDAGCTAPTARSSARYNDTLFQIYNLLRPTLGNGHGSLLLLASRDEWWGSNVDWFIGNPSLWLLTTDRTSGLRTREQFRNANTHVGRRLHVALLLSGAFALMSGGLLTSALFVVLRKIQKDAWQAAVARKRQRLRRKFAAGHKSVMAVGHWEKVRRGLAAGGAGGNLAATEAAMAPPARSALEAEEEEAIQREIDLFVRRHAPTTFPFRNPFDDIHERLSDLFVQPLREKRLNSLRLFLNEACGGMVPKRMSMYQRMKLSILGANTTAADVMQGAGPQNVTCTDYLRLIFLGKLKAEPPAEAVWKEAQERLSYDRSVSLDTFKEKYEEYCFEQRLRPVGSTPDEVSRALRAMLHVYDSQVDSAMLYQGSDGGTPAASASAKRLIKNLQKEQIEMEHGTDSSKDAFKRHKHHWLHRRIFGLRWQPDWADPVDEQLPWRVAARRKEEAAKQEKSRPSPEEDEDPDEGARPVAPASRVVKHTARLAKTASRRAMRRASILGQGVVENMMENMEDALDLTVKALKTPFAVLLIDFFGILVHVGSLTGPSIAAIFYALDLQRRWSLTIAPIDMPISAINLNYNSFIWPSFVASGTARQTLLPGVFGIFMWNYIICWVVIIRLGIAYYDVFGEHSILTRLARCVRRRTAPGAAQVVPVEEERLTSTSADGGTARSSANAPHPIPVPSFIPQFLGFVFGLLMMAHTFFMLSFAALFFAWMLLVAVLNPTKYLAYGSSVITVFLVAWRMLRKLKSLSKLMKSLISECFAKITREVLALAFEQFEAKYVEKMQAQLEQQAPLASLMTTDEVIDDKSAGPDSPRRMPQDRPTLPTRMPSVKRQSSSGSEKSVQGKLEALKGRIFVYHKDKDQSNELMGDRKAAQDMLASQVFDFLDLSLCEAGSEPTPGVLTEQEFYVLFKILPLPLNRAQQEQLYLQCDKDGRGTISKEEFLAGWSLLVRALQQAFLTEYGLSNTQILSFLVLTILTLLVFFWFFFTALSAWTGGGGFESVTQSVFLAGGGGLLSFRNESGFSMLLDEVDELKSRVSSRFRRAARENGPNGAGFGAGTASAT